METMTALSPAEVLELALHYARSYLRECESHRCHATGWSVREWDKHINKAKADIKRLEGK